MTRPVPGCLSSVSPRASQSQRTASCHAPAGGRVLCALWNLPVVWTVVGMVYVGFLALVVACVPEREQ